MTMCTAFRTECWTNSVADSELSQCVFKSLTIEATLSEWQRLWFWKKTKTFEKYRQAAADQDQSQELCCLRSNSNSKDVMFKNKFNSVNILD
jgi:hypothetical protein